MHHGTTRSWEAGIPLPLGLCVGIRQRDRFRIIRGQQSETLSKNQPCRSADHFEILKQMPICIDALLCLNLVVNFLCRNAGTRVASGQQGLGHPKVSAGPWPSRGVSRALVISRCAPDGPKEEGEGGADGPAGAHGKDKRPLSAAANTWLQGVWGGKVSEKISWAWRTFSFLPQ